MANHKSAIKRNRQNIKRNTRNRAERSKVRTAIKRVQAAIASGDATQAETLLKAAIPVIDSSGTKGLFHANNVARKVSRLVHAVAKIKAAPAQ